MQISIIGAGIAGVSCALALAGGDNKIKLYEQASRLEAIGAGLQIGPNAVRALQELGVWDVLEPHCVAPDCIRVCDAVSGRELSVLPLGDSFTKKFGAPYRVAHRADLLRSLAETAAKNKKIQLNTTSRIDLIEQDDTFTIPGKGRKKPTPDLIIAADGIRSSTRALIAPDHEPRSSGQTLYRGQAPASTLPDSLDPNAIYLWLAPGGHIVHYMVSGGRRLNIVASVDANVDAKGWNALARLEDILQQLPTLNPTLKQVLECPASWLAWPGADLEPFTGWSKHNCILVGDAAHATLPYLAQGAAMALEDATCLASLMQTQPDVPSALSAFEQQRHARTSRIIQESRRNGKIYHLSGLPASARNIFMRIMPASMQLSRFDWVYRD